MHSRIFQIASRPIDKDDYISEYDISENDYGSYGIDYADESGSERADDLKWLKAVLPESMFAVDGDSVTILNKGEEYLAGILADIKAIMQKMRKPNDLLAIDNYVARKLMRNLDHSEALFYFDEWCGGVCYLDDIIRYAQEHVGEKLYVGAILDYHF